MKKAIVLGLAVALISPQVQATAPKCILDKVYGITSEDDGLTHTNIDKFNKYADYFYFLDNNIRIGIGESVTVSYVLDQDGFDDLSLFTINVGNGSVATVDNATTQKCEIHAVSKGSTLLTGYYNGIAIANLKITVVDAVADENDDSSGQTGIGGNENSGDDVSSGNDNFNSIGMGEPNNLGTTTGIGNGSNAGSSTNNGKPIGTGTGTLSSSSTGITDDETDDLENFDSYSLSTAVFSFDKSSISLEKGLSKKVKYSQKDGVAKNLKFEVKNNKIASVSAANGELTVKALAAGSTTVVVTNVAGAKYKSTLSVKVVDYATKIKLSKQTLSLAKKGKSATLKVSAVSGTLHPSGTLKWSSSKVKVAKVTQKGVVKAVAKGSANITVKYTATVKGKKVTHSVKCKVIVKS